MGNKPRRWIKLYCYETLHGSVSYQLTAAERDVWNSLLCLAGLCGMEGVIADHDSRPFPEAHIIKEVNTTLETYKSTLKKCTIEGRIRQNGDGTLIITNWAKYQSEYDRQKPSRQMRLAEKQGKPIPKKCECGFKQMTTAKVCPDCGKELERDYTGGAYGHMVRH